MTILLKQSTASQEVPLGYFLDSTDGNTEETALTIANTDIKLWKNGATTLANKNSGGATHISNGVYYCTLDATDTNTLGPLVIFVHVSGALATRLECLVLTANVFDSLVSGTDYLDTFIAAGGIISGAIASAELNNIADAFLKRDWTAVSGAASRSALNALRFLRNRWAIAAGTLTVYQEDDTTSAWTGAVTTTAGNPTSQIDPS